MDLIGQEVPLVWLDDLISRGAHAHLGGPGCCKYTFLQGYLEEALEKYSLPQMRHEGTLPYDQLLPRLAFVSKPVITGALRIHALRLYR